MPCTSVIAALPVQQPSLPGSHLPSGTPISDPRGSSFGPAPLFPPATHTPSGTPHNDQHVGSSCPAALPLIASEHPAAVRAAAVMLQTAHCLWLQLLRSPRCRRCRCCHSAATASRNQPGAAIWGFGGGWVRGQPKQGRRQLATVLMTSLPCTPMHVIIGGQRSALTHCVPPALALSSPLPRCVTGLLTAATPPSALESSV